MRVRKRFWQAAEGERSEAGMELDLGCENRNLFAMLSYKQVT